MRPVSLNEEAALSVDGRVYNYRCVIPYLFVFIYSDYDDTAYFS